MNKVKHIEKKYGVDLKVKSNMKISTYLRKIGFPSLAKLIEKK